VKFVVAKPKLGLGSSVLLGIFGLFLITRDKSVKKNPVGDTLITNEAEIIGANIGDGMGGNVFQLPNGDALKVVALDTKYGDDAINQDQADFIEMLWLKKLKRRKEGRKDKIPDDFVKIKHYNRGYAGPKLVELVNSEVVKHKLKIGDKIAYWVMEYVPVIGNGEMTSARIRGGENRIKRWMNLLGYDVFDLHQDNYGEREDGSFVAFDMWPKKMDGRPIDRRDD
jgi:hypothetical protein